VDAGERGCGVWEVRPRLGLIGMLAGWWQLKLSSGCPLAEGRALGARPDPAETEGRPRHLVACGPSHRPAMPPCARRRAEGHRARDGHVLHGPDPIKSRSGCPKSAARPRSVAHGWPARRQAC
jgi:hypothetical protein